MLLINVVHYDPLWPVHFAQIHTELADALSDFLPRDPQESYTIEHVGSTSVPGLCAKPIIDIDIVVPSQYIMEATQALTSHGYTYAYEPTGMDRMVFRYNAHALDSGASKPTEDGRPRRAVYLNKAGGAALANHLAVRDTLRRDEGLRAEYARVKWEMRGKVVDHIGEYGKAKAEVIWKILQQSGLGAEELERIKQRQPRRVDLEINERRAKERAVAVEAAEAAGRGS